MSTYLSLTNELLRRMGEVTIDSSDFGSTRNVQELAKNAINSSIRDLLHSAQEWPFALVTNTQTLTVGVNTYALPSTASSVDWDSFYLKNFNNSVSALRLPSISYSNYLMTHRARDDNAGVGGYSPPSAVFQTQEFKFGVTPIPNEEYEIEYKYWSFPSDLVAFDDVSIIPDRFSSVIIDGAMVYMMLYRSNEQSATMHKATFEEGIKKMRRLLMDEPLSVVSTALTNSSSTLNIRVI